jgi:Zn-dependent alcohol dehydrogenase
MYVRGYISDDAGWLTKFLFEGLGASINVAKPPKGSTVAIFGLGAVGLAVSVAFFFCHSMPFNSNVCWGCI